MLYLLRHKNINIALINIDDNLGTVLGLRLSKHISHLPYGVNGEKSLVKWLLNRGVPATRQGLSLDLKSLSTASPFELMINNLGLSLTDSYWLNTIDSNLSWEDVNLYKNNFKSTYNLDLRSDKKNIAGKTNFTPNASLKGDLKKKWIIDQNGTRRLVKGNYSSSCRQSLCEVLATELHRLQKKATYTPYSLIDISSDNQDIIGCECPNFTDINTEFIPAIDIVESTKKPNDISWYEFYIRLCESNGVDLRYFMEYQILTDFVISNSDRHLNNFGILRDSNTLQWLRPAPIFDSGNSMFYKSQYIPIDKALLKLEVTSFLSREVQLLRYVTNRGLIDISKLPSTDYVYSLLSKDIYKDEVSDRLVKAYLKKIKYLDDFQNGASIWSYSYKG